MAGALAGVNGGANNVGTPGVEEHHHHNKAHRKHHAGRKPPTEEAQEDSVRLEELKRQAAQQAQLISHQQAQGITAGAFPQG
jgi:hypothetical protein